MSRVDSDWEGIPIIHYDPASEPTSLHTVSMRPKHYRHLDSIDWAHEYARDHETKLVSDNRSRWRYHFRQSARWIVLIGTGVLIGVLTSSLDYAYKWFTDVKDGICKSGFYNTKSACCASFSDIGEGSLCSNWASWDEMIGIDESAAGSFLYKYFVFIVTSLVFAAMAAFIVKNAVFVKTSGISEVKTVISGVILEDFLADKTLLKKLFGLVFGVSANLWIGKEGPLVHIACCCADLLIRLFPVIDDNEAKRRELLVAASAAGISVAFNAPISGVIFTLEQLTSYFNPSDKMWTSFVCAMVGTFVLNSFKEGIDIYVAMDNQWLSLEMLGFILLGVAGGLYGAIFSNLNIKFAQIRKQYISSRGPQYEVLEVICLAGVTALLCYPLAFPRMPLTSLIGRLYKDCEAIDEDIIGGLCSAHSGYSVSLLITTAVVATILSSYTFGTIVPAGVLMPSLAVGAIFGRALGIIIEDIQEAAPFLSSICENSPELCVSPGAYAVIGSAAFLAGTTKMTVWVVVTVFELTGALSYVLPIMITVIVARWTNDKFDELNCYDQWIKFFGYPYLIEVNSPIPLTKSVEIMKPLETLDVIYLEDNMTVAELESVLDFKYQGLPILESRENPRLFGWISITELQDEYIKVHASANYDANREVNFGSPSQHSELYQLGHLVEHDHLTLGSELPLPSLVDIFFKMKPRFVLFSKDGLFCGLITLKDLSRIVERA